MSKRRLNVPSSGRLAELDLVSYGRRGRETPLRFSQAQLEQIDRTVRGDSEVMVKVSGGGKTLDAVKAHVGYIDRHGKLKVNTDEGERLGKGLAEELVYDWHLDVGKGRYRPLPKAGEKDRRPRQAHNIVFSMPAGTSPQKLLAATQSGPRVVLGNKSDVSAAWPIQTAGVDVLAVSAKSGRGIDELRGAIINALSGRDRLRDTPAVTNARHAGLLSRAADALRRAAHAAEEQTAEEFVAADVSEARAMLEEVTGARTPDDMLHAIFSRFCIGK